MQQLRLSGPGTGSDKYDLLTALSVVALAQGGQMQVSLLRLMVLVTARYNWAQDELSLGQREMAQMWSVDERTAKREVKRLLDLGLLSLLHKGVKGRVARYRLSYAEICRLTADHWARVGSDYQTRMAERHLTPTPAPPSPETVVRVDFAARHKASPGPLAEDPWGRVQQRLERADPVRHAAWFAPLGLASVTEDLVVLQAPSGFAATYVTTHFIAVLEAACRAEFGAEIRCLVRG